ncbi:beta-microseminoprotein-like isoform X1 [Pristis pectinata]|uniref:beta-microseminoprotein-like isoform X1 n=1 Tax=Pristis pectinata TaxID=685728 RepID=UPI00223DAECC|nr:beta-microseminoprotein-like isoform X1 [Pristis pectinata]
MKLLLCIALLFLAAQLSESGCILRRKDATADCIDPFDGSVHPVRQSWLDSVCRRCRCGEEFAECCPTVPTPVGYPEDCVALFNPRRCRYRVSKKNDPSIECPVTQSVL